MPLFAFEHVMPLTRACLSDGRYHGVVGELLKKKPDLRERVHTRCRGLQVVHARGVHQVQTGDRCSGKSCKHSRA